MATAHPEASAVAQQMMAELEQAGLLGTEAGREPPSAPAGGASALRMLPRQTGTVHADSLGRDELGVTLIGARQPPAHRPRQGGSSAGGSEPAGG
jgi:hypothetical protein